jgi:hypothetical protein
LGVSEGCGPGVGGPIFSGLFVWYGGNTKNSHLRQTPNDPQTNAKTSACGAGTYSSVESATTCTTCGTGKYSGSEGATSESTCNKCQAGTYSGVEGATAATTCQGEFVSFGEPYFVWVDLFRGLGSGGGCPRGGRVGCGSGAGGSDFFRFFPGVNTKTTHTYIKP